MLLWDLFRKFIIHPWKYEESGAPVTEKIKNKKDKGKCEQQ